MIRAFHSIQTIRHAVVALLVGTLGLSAAAATPKLNDQGIIDAVRNSLHFDPSVKPDKLNLNVACQDGVITLTGQTDNLLGSERAARLAETVKGVRSVINRVNVVPSESRRNDEIERDIIAALAGDPATDSYDVDVKVAEKGHVTLDGTVQSWQERELTKTVAKGVKGVTELTSNIKVNPAAQRPDSEIEPEVQKALQWDTLVDASAVQVEVNDGKVMLTGTIGSAAERRRAVYTAWVHGVTDVDDSQLKVRDWAKDPQRRRAMFPMQGDDAIRQALLDAYRYDARVSAFAVEPTVKNGEVTLRGMVDNLRAKQAAAETARHTWGVARVVNLLTVRPTKDRPDSQLETDVRSALYRDPTVDRFEISVDVVDGAVALTGVVDSYYEKAQAESLAASVNGVTLVENNLKVTDLTRPLIYDPYTYDWYLYDYPWYDYSPPTTIEEDKEIQDEIVSELWWSPFVNSDNVTVAVNNGVATLSGTAGSWSEVRTATSNAYEGGAIAVNNNMVVVAQ